MNKKRGILYWLRVILCFCCLGWFFYRCSAELTASAAPTIPASDSVLLTPAQTLALYGTQIDALYYDFYHNDPYSIHFDYAFPLQQIGYMEESNGGFDNSTISSSVGFQNGLGSNVAAEFIGNMSGLVYVADASQWGNYQVLPYSYNSNTSRIQLHVPFSISLSGIGRIQECFCYSTKHGYESSSPRTPWNKNIITMLTDIANAEFYSLSGTTYANVTNAAIFNLPTYSYYSSVAPLDETQVGRFSGFIVDLYEEFDNGAALESFDVTGLTLDAYAVTSITDINNNVWLIVGCPRLWGYTPPAITTTVPAETIPAATYPVETMPPDVTDVPLNVINQNLVTNNYQLNLIIGQLNLIYAELKAQGQLGLKVNIPWDPDLLEGEDITFYGTDIEQQMQNIMTTYTIAGNPELNDNNDFVKSAFQAFWEVGWLAALGLFSLVVSLTSWILFNGRKG